MSENSQSLAGQTLRWKFEDGPTAGTTYEHTFRPDGTVVFRDVSAGEKGMEAEPTPAETKAPRYASYEVAPSTHLVSYLSDSGYTLTVALNLDTQRCYGIASNEKEWHPLKGTLVQSRQDRSAA
jgi:hypothetical protein